MNIRLLENFKTTINYWIEVLKQHSIEQLTTKPNSESWSLGQVCQHIINETNFYIGEIETCLKNKENKDAQMTETSKQMFKNNEFPNERFKGDPFISETMKQPSDKKDIEIAMLKLRKDVKLLWHKITSSDSIGKTKHPGFGYFNATEWFQYAEMHMRHHLRQKGRIETFLKTQITDF